MRARKVSKIPRQEQSSGYGGGKIGVIPRQVGYRGYGARETSVIPRQEGQQESWEGVNSAKIE